MTSEPPPVDAGKASTERGPQASSDGVRSHEVRAAHSWPDRRAAAGTVPAGVETADAQRTGSQSAEAGTAHARTADATTSEARTADATTADATTADATTVDARTADAGTSSAVHGQSESTDAVPVPQDQAGIDALRLEIDAIDRELVRLIHRRSAISHAIGAARKSFGGPRIVYSREMAILERFRELGPAGTDLGMMLLAMGRGRLGRK